MSTTRGLLLAGATALALLGAAHAQTSATPAAPGVPAAAAKGPPPGFVAPAEPKPDDSNAERAKSQPGNNAPLWRSVRESGRQPGYSSLPAVESGVLIQPFVQYPGAPVTNAGEAWRQVRNRWIIPYGGSLFVLVLAAIALYYWRRGPMGGRLADTGRTIERFTAFERAAHLAAALTFVVLALSGLVLAFGKFVLLPVFGATLFGWLAYALKTLHNFVGPLFLLSILVMIVGYLRDNIPRAYDFAWLARFGGMFGGQEVPSHRFNAGEKMVFWGGVIVLGLTVAGSGLVLDKLWPGLEYTRVQMQVWHMVHAVASVLMMTMFLGHIYMGTIGMKGALQAMKTGRVDEAWAREHHELWFDDIQAGRIPAERSRAPAPGVPSAARS